MSGDKMEVELAEQKLKTMEHSEQHYFKRYVLSPKRKETKCNSFSLRLSWANLQFWRLGD